MGNDLGNDKKDVRLIDANALILEIQEDIDLESNGETGSKEQLVAEQLVALGLKIALKNVMKAPTVKAEPVKHGRFKAYSEKEKYERYKKCHINFDGACSECGSNMFDTDKFCAECGAKIIGGDNE